MIMRRIIFLLVAVSIVLSGCKSQQDPVKAAISKAEQDAIYEKAIQALNNREFVLEADRITFKYGRFAYVNSSTNFISLHGDKATVQLAFNSPYAGPNGIGGITVDGRASNIKMETDKKGNVTFSMSVQGVGISANVSFDMVQGTNECSATVTPNFSSNRITFSGELYNENESSVFKGRSL